jgi:cephalosporin hydroxylase
MKLIIDTAAGTLTTENAGSERTQPLYSKEAWEAISLQWVRLGWSLGTYYNFSWFGRPILQLPEDLVRLQEVIYRLQPDLIIETGVYRGGSMVFHASLCQAIGKGRVIGIDQRIPAADREAIVGHPLAGRITLIEGDSISGEVIQRVAALVDPAETVLVILDSCHERAHVRQELELYSPFVTPGSYIVATDGIMRDLTDVPGGNPEWRTDNPAAAARDFAAAHPEFQQEQPPWPFKAGDLTQNVTYWPEGWLKRVR